MDRQTALIVVSKRILIFSSIVLVACIGLVAYADFGQKRMFIIPFIFGCGIMGGFVSIQQRIKRIDDLELLLLSQSWALVMVIPIFGGVFALVLYLLFLSGIVTGELFPKFVIAPFSSPPLAEDVRNFLRETHPASGVDFAKLAFWSFVAGFSERLVPQIVSGIAERSEGAGSEHEATETHHSSASSVSVHK